MPYNVLYASLLGLVFIIPMGQHAAHAVPINLVFDNTVTVAQQAVYRRAAQIIEWNVLGRTVLDNNAVTINISTPAIDGPGGILGSAGPTQLRIASGTPYTNTGAIRFDIADTQNALNNGTLLAITLHEMFHVMGFGTLWNNTFNANPVYVDGSGQYTGANALAAYRAEFDPTATFVPVELDGGPGTANGHWDEEWAGGRAALLTGNLEGGPTFLSTTTVRSFADIGFFTARSAIIPVPASGILMASGLGLMGMVGNMARKRSAKRKKA